MALRQTKTMRENEGEISGLCTAKGAGRDPDGGKRTTRLRPAWSCLRRDAHMWRGCSG